MAWEAWLAQLLTGPEPAPQERRTWPEDRVADLPGLGEDLEVGEVSQPGDGGPHPEPLGWQQAVAGPWHWLDLRIVNIKTGSPREGFNKNSIINIPFILS